MTWLRTKGFQVGTATRGRFGAAQGTINGLRSGGTGYRIEFDARSGAHINVFSGKEKWHFIFPGGQSAVKSLLRQLGI